MGETDEKGNLCVQNKTAAAVRARLDLHYSPVLKGKRFQLLGEETMHAWEDSHLLPGLSAAQRSRRCSPEQARDQELKSPLAADSNFHPFGHFQCSPNRL